MPLRIDLRKWWTDVYSACRSLGVLPPQEAAAMSRDELEADLHLLALLLFRNELKPDTAQAITDLKQGQVRTTCFVFTAAPVFLHQCGHVVRCPALWRHALA